MDIIWLIVGLVLILVGANVMTDGASAIAKRMGVSELVIGLTVVAIGTSAPELVISVLSSIEGKASLAIGNVVGSNIFNVLVIIGVTAMVRPIVVERSVMTAEIPMVLLSSAVLLMLGNSGELDGTGVNEVSRVSGIFLLIFLLLFMRYTFAGARHDTQASQAPAPGQKTMPVWRAVVYLFAGIAALVWGGDRFVSGASGIARMLDISEGVIGLTIVAAGTSLPELATSVVAAMKNSPGLAVGNVIGSNIINILLVLGLSATISPLPFGSVGNFDLLTLMVASVLFYLSGWLYGHRTITRIEGALLTLCYVVYISVLIMNL